MKRLAILILALPVTAGAEAKFASIRGGTLGSGASAQRVDDFEMAVHPVTNAEFARFVAETGHAAPLHWTSGKPPADMENHPVIFVNRYDAAGYSAWLSGKERRVYRLPTASEFEYAARGGDPRGKYPWGNEAPAGKANFDTEGKRTFAEWRQYLDPVGRYAPNRWGLYDMAGNVWQMVDSYPDPAAARFKYRIARQEDLETGIAGGSWARAAYYLECGVRGGASPGIRHPDLGFRLVREPSGSTHFRRQTRRLIALPAGSSRIFLGWQLLASDQGATGFHVYRSTRRDSAGQRLTTKPVTVSTNFLDEPAPASGRLYYRVRGVGADGEEGPPSEWAAVEAGSEPSRAAMVIEPTAAQGGFLPVFGDLDGDGVLDAVIRLDNGLREMSRDGGLPVELEAFTHYGRQLWRRPLVRHDHCFGSANNVPVVVYDLNSDGRAEVVARVQEEGKIWLAILDGMSGRTLRRTPWTDMVSDFSKSSTRIHMSVAFLNGKTPALITQTGLYENEILDAFDGELNKLWQYQSFAETNGSWSHHIDIADVDGDGRDEVFNGTMVLNPDGSLRWALYREHPDIVAIKHILPGRKERQVYFAVESNVHAGAYLVDASTGKIHWKVNREDDPRWVHAHTGWAADIDESSPGMEMLTNRDGHLVKDLVLFSAEGKILMNPFPQGWHPVNWTGGSVRELMSTDGLSLGRFTGSGVTPLGSPGPNPGPKGNCRMVADLVGDYRDEVICAGVTSEGRPALYVYTNTDVATRRDITRTASREYNLWLARNQGGGYASYFEWQR